jgi:anti-sigma B factor antagonist
MVVSVPFSKVDARVAVDLKSKLKELINEGKTKIVLDLSEVDFIDSSGLGALVTTLKRVRPEGDIRLSGVRDRVKSLLELTRLDNFFEVHISNRAAIESFGISENGDQI